MNRSGKNKCLLFHYGARSLTILCAWASLTLFFAWHDAAVCAEAESAAGTPPAASARDASPKTTAKTTAKPSAKTTAKATDASSLKQQKTPSESAPEPKQVSINFVGDIDGEGTFTFRDGTVTYNHLRHQYPSVVMINGKTWADLDEPFELGFIPDFSTMRIKEKRGRNTIRPTYSEDSFELYIYDSDSSSSTYRITLTCQATVTGASQETKVAVEEPDEVDRLRGVLYDFKETSDHRAVNLMKLQGGKQFNRLRTAANVWNLPGTENEFNMIPFLKQFVLSNWQCRTDYKGDLFYRDLGRFERSTAATSKSYFYQTPVSSAVAPA